MTAVIQGAFGTALLNFGPRASIMGHGPLDFSRVKANVSAGVPNNLGGPRETTSGGSPGPPEKRSACRYWRNFRSQSLCPHD